MTFRIRRGPIAADNFTIISNGLLRCNRLSLKARGLAAWLLSHRDDFELTLARIAQLTNTGVDSIRSAVAELEAEGFLVRERVRDDKGRLEGALYYITDQPLTDESAGQDQDGETQRRSGQHRSNPPHKKTTSNQKTTDKSAAPASEPVLDLDLPEPSPPEQAEDKPPTINQRAVKLAQAHYERLGGMGNVAAWVQVIRKALERDFSDAAVDAALAWIADRQWTLTEERLAHTLRGGPRPAGRTAPALKPTVRTGPGGRGPELEY